ncbi:related to endoplasmic reticulum retention receptor [Ramularia collo-cygni]|uniref:Related to endoplasmic reticulum retention receptor n=1 Tax=Ramularia collo-cygni TaxID=112498 RepID=A0A2D3VM42_9PEZI|nr:related to endoplasmic reticulum retention receptor [Ramularia collo-cygni]CZT22453.1 related to endoplasmic reticulum retention receptor [Ramularia collo-cygni]
MNIFRILGDVSHSASKIILIWSCHNNKSAEGVSLLTQLLYILVFGSRYLDLFWVPPSVNLWNFVLKICYISSSAYIVFIMMRVFARTREKEYGWKLAIWSLVGSTVGAPIVCLLFEGWVRCGFSELLWTFSIILESVCVLPQLLLLRQTNVPTVLDSFYLVTLGTYRFFYILNWVVLLFTGGKFDAISFIFGVVQTALYMDFAWVYWTRQRVKLRGGGLVDSDDLSKSFLVKRLIGRRGNRNSTDGDNDEDELDADTATLSAQENGVVRPSVSRSGRSWGARGISVSADQPEDDEDDGAAYLDQDAGDAQMVDPSHFEDNSDDDTDAPAPPAKDTKPKPGDGVDEADEEVGSSAAEWQDGGSK